MVRYLFDIEISYKWDKQIKLSLYILKKDKHRSINFAVIHNYKNREIYQYRDTWFVGKSNYWKLLEWKK